MRSYMELPLQEILTKLHISCEGPGVPCGSDKFNRTGKAGVCSPVARARPTPYLLAVWWENYPTMLVPVSPLMKWEPQWLLPHKVQRGGNTWITCIQRLAVSEGLGSDWLFYYEALLWTHYPCGQWWGYKRLNHILPCGMIGRSTPGNS